MYWRIYIRYSLSGAFKYNFVGNKTELMTLVGVIHSTSIEQCRVDYQEVKEIDQTLEIISYVINSKKTYLYTHKHIELNL